jgi:hypothetical protein
VKDKALTADRLRVLVSYEPATGLFYRLQPSSWAKAGDVCGSKNAKGYLEFNVLGRLYRAHRLAWLYVHGRWPDGDVDHIDGNKENNAISNLREVSNRKNSENRRRANKNSASGALGVRLRKASGKFEARIRVDGRLKYLGVHETQEAASNAYINAKRQFHEGNTL